MQPTINPIEAPSYFREFFGSLYEDQPLVVSEKKGTITYGVQGGGLSLKTDRYGGCHIEIKDSSVDPRFQNRLREQISRLSEEFQTSHAFDSIWIRTPRPAPANLLASMTPENWISGDPQKGDRITDFQNRMDIQWQWLNPNKECKIPPGATHNMGAVAAIVNEKGQLILVSPQTRQNSWNLPGGNFDPAKDLCLEDTAMREAREELGLRVNLVVLGMVGKASFPTNQLAPAENIAFAVTTKEGDTLSELQPDAEEIDAAQAFDLDEILAHDPEKMFYGRTLSREIQPIAAALQAGAFAKLQFDKGWMKSYVVEPPTSSKDLPRSEPE